jgi:serine/threonine-protein kinase
MLHERYRIDAILARGGMGVVYRAWDERLDVSVAVKEMSPQAELSPERFAQLRVQFRQEARTLARLNHPNLVRVIDSLSYGEAEYLVMGFVKGSNLVELIRQHGPLPEAQVRIWAGHLLDALAYCHQNGVYHRDVKPQNVIIDPDGRAVLVDFGLVKQTEANGLQTITAIRGMGTPEYAPPEQCGFGAAHTDAKSDLYSLGATLYHALTGQAPPEAAQRMAHPELLRPISELVPGVSQRTEQAITKAIEMPVRARWQSASEMANALGVTGPVALPAATPIDPISTPPGSTIAMPPPPIQARPTWIRWAAGAFALVVVLVAAVWVTRSQGWWPGAGTPEPTEVAVVHTATPTMEQPAVTATRTAISTRPPTRTPTYTPVPPTATATATPSPRPTATATATTASQGITQESPTATATATATATTPPTPTTAPTATATPSPTPTATWTPTATTPPSPPPTAGASATATATATPVNRWLAAPALLSPLEGEEFVGWNAQVLLQWSNVGQLYAAEYYVVRIPYDEGGGVAEFWRKETSMQVPPHLSRADVGFADRHYNWTVQVLHCTQECEKAADDNARKQGYVVGNPSVTGTFYWHPDTGSRPKSTPTGPQPTPTR